MMTDKQKESPGGTAACPSDGTAGSDTGSGVHGSADLVRPGERVDDLQRAGLRIIQDPELFCFGMDAVLLSAYVQMKKARRGLDLGTGNGIIPILLSDRTDCLSLTGLEIQEASADLAKRSVALNGLGDRISIVRGDIREADRIFAAASFDFITCNPPYRQAGSGRITGTPAGGGKAIGTSAGSGRITGTPAGGGKAIVASAGSGRITGTPAGGGKAIGTPAGNNPRGQSQENGQPKGDAAPDQTAGTCGIDPRAIARHEILCSFEDVVRVAAALLRPGGHFYLVHRPLRLAELITKLCTGGLEPKRMRLVYPHVDKAPNMVLLDCVRGGAPELRVEPPLIVYDGNGSYTPELLEIYYGDQSKN